MGGGKSKSEKVAPVVAPTIDPWGYQGSNGYQQYQNQGYQPTPQTFTQAGKPSWMQGHFAMPEWGMRADDPTQQVTPAMLDPRTAMFAQRDAYNAIGNPAAQQALGNGSVQEAIARYAGQSSMMQGPRGQTPAATQIPANRGKGFAGGVGDMMGQAANQAAAGAMASPYGNSMAPTSGDQYASMMSMMPFLSANQGTNPGGGNVG
jgi:hypothetical protein